jgi:hypothetical protein
VAKVGAASPSLHAGANASVMANATRVAALRSLAAVRARGWIETVFREAKGSVFVGVMSDLLVGGHEESASLPASRA